MKQKILSLLLTSTLVFTLASCGSQEKAANSLPDSEVMQEISAEDTSASSENASSQESFNVEFSDDKHSLSIAWWGNDARAQRTKEVLELYSEQNPSVDFVCSPLEWSDYWNQLNSLASTNALPDCIQMDYSFLEQYVKEGLLTDLTPYVESGVLDVSDVDPGILEAGSVDGKLYAVCGGVNAPALLYNKTLLDELGIAIHDNMTLDEFMDISRTVYKKSGVKTALPYASGDSYLFYLLRTQGITQPFANNSLNVPNAKSFLPGFQLYETGTKEDWIIGAEIYAELNINEVAQSPMICYTSTETSSWCGFYWSNQMASMINATPEGMEIGITTWPSDNAKKTNYLKPSQFFCVSKDAGENEEETVKVINYLLNSVDANSILLGERGIPASSKVAAEISPLLDDTSKTITAYINNIITPNCSPINPPLPSGAMEIYDYSNQLIDRILMEQITAPEAAVNLYEHASDIMNNTKSR